MIYLIKSSFSHCCQITLLTVTLTGQMFFLSQSKISITAESYFGVGTGETIRCAEDIVSLPICMRYLLHMSYPFALKSQYNTPSQGQITLYLFLMPIPYTEVRYILTRQQLAYFCP